MRIMNERKYSVMELVKMLEEALPEGQVVVVGNGEGLTDEQKAWLHSLTDCECQCDGECECNCCGCNCGRCNCGNVYTQEEYDYAIDEAYNEGYTDGESHKEAEITEAYDEGYAEALRDVKSIIADLG